MLGHQHTLLYKAAKSLITTKKGSPFETPALLILGVSIRSKGLNWGNFGIYLMKMFNIEIAIKHEEVCDVLSLRKCLSVGK